MIGVFFFSFFLSFSISFFFLFFCCPFLFLRFFLIFVIFSFFSSLLCLFFISFYFFLSVVWNTVDRNTDLSTQSKHYRSRSRGIVPYSCWPSERRGYRETTRGQRQKKIESNRFPLPTCFQTRVRDSSYTVNHSCRKQSEHYSNVVGNVKHLPTFSSEPTNHTTKAKL